MQKPATSRSQQRGEKRSGMLRIPTEAVEGNPSWIRLSPVKYWRMHCPDWNKRSLQAQTRSQMKHLGPKAKKKLIQLFNESRTTGIVLQVWREAIMIPGHMKGKDKTKAESYRPISLINCIGELYWRTGVALRRLMWHLEDKQHISPVQAASRQDRSTEDQIT